ncbi:MAG: DUF4097 domain-containing protein [Butyrivibrio sp.]|nr:DUF4097 domain-containing protein [Butyrivibrio sp.]
MRLEKKITIFVAIALVVIGIGMMSLSLFAAGGNIMNLIKTVEYAEKTIDITDQNFTSIDIQIGAHDIQILKSDDKNTHFECHEASDDKYKIHVQGNTLVIENKASWNLKQNLLVSRPHVMEVLYLPGDTYQDFTCKVGSGDVYLQPEFTFDNVEVSVGSGEATLENFRAKDIKVHSGSGDIYLKDMVSAGVDIHIGSGDITVNNLDCESEFQAESMSGKIKLTDVVSDNRFYSSTGSGDIYLDGCDGHSMEFKTGSGDVQGTLLTAKKFDAKSGSGDIRIPQDGGEGRCNIKTGSGDIDISIK